MMEKYIRYAIFDADGTIFDSMHIWDEVGIKFLNAKGIQPTDDLMERMKVFSLSQSAQYLIETYHLSESVQELIDSINQLVKDFYLYEVSLKKGVKDYLQFLHASNIPMCILSASNAYLIQQALKRNEIDLYFKHIFTCENLGYPKEDPKVFQVVCDQMKYQIEDTWVFEDAPYSMRAAKKSGLYVVGIYDASQDQIAVQSLCDRYIEDFEQLL